MSNDIVLNQSKLATPDDYDDLGAGTRIAFPVLSYRGKEWKLNWQRQEMYLVDEQGQPVKEIGVCLLKVPANMSKRYFDREYKKGERPRPSCWSDDGKKPHPNATIPIQPDGRPQPTICAACFMDTIGSKTSADKTKRMKACADSKRVSVKLISPVYGLTLIELPGGNTKWDDTIFPLEENGVLDIPMLLNVPQASHANLREYGKFLEQHKAYALGRVTWIGFVMGEAFPKLTFRHGAEFDDNTYEQMKELRNSDETIAILARGEEETNGSEPVEEPTALEDKVVKTIAKAISSGHVPDKPQAVVTPLSTPIPQPIKPAAVAPVNVPPPPPEPIKPAFVPGGRPVKPQIATALSKPAAPPPSARTVEVPPPQAEGLEYGEAELSDEVDQMFNALKLEGKTN